MKNKTCIDCIYCIYTPLNNLAFCSGNEKLFGRKIYADQNVCDDFKDVETHDSYGNEINHKVIKE